jgi:alkanesulfonate monooxygenase SsuD/methylene tetrahydromethanopterin reductase-like flavin-dependent oxidoreductase (luciferase family)
VLERHCAAVGRNRRQITVTYKSPMFVAASEASARRDWDVYRAPRGLPPESAAFVGTPEQVSRQVAAILNAGVDEVIVEIADAHDLDALRQADEVLRMAAPEAVLSS